VRLLGRYSSGNLSSPSGTFNFSVNKQARQNTRFQTKGLPKPEKDPSTKSAYILHIIAKNTCGSRIFYSNVSSRYLNCGVEPVVSINSFMNTLSTSVR
jgi:hypothetical protein